MNSWNIMGNCFYLNMHVLADQEDTFRIYLDEENKFKISVPQGIFCTFSVLKVLYSGCQKILNFMCNLFSYKNCLVMCVFCGSYNLEMLSMPQYMKLQIRGLGIIDSLMGMKENMAGGNDLLWRINPHKIWQYNKIEKYLLIRACFQWWRDPY